MAGNYAGPADYILDKPGEILGHLLAAVPRRVVAGFAVTVAAYRKHMKIFAQFRQHFHIILPGLSLTVDQQKRDGSSGSADAVAEDGTARSGHLLFMVAAVPDFAHELLISVKIFIGKAHDRHADHCDDYQYYQ